MTRALTSALIATATTGLCLLLTGARDIWSLGIATVSWLALFGIAYSYPGWRLRKVGGSGRQ